MGSSSPGRLSRQELDSINQRDHRPAVGGRIAGNRGDYLLSIFKSQIAVAVQLRLDGAIGDLADERLDLAAKISCIADWAAVERDCREPADGVGAKTNANRRQLAEIGRAARRRRGGGRRILRHWLKSPCGKDQRGNQSAESQKRQQADFQRRIAALCCANPPSAITCELHGLCFPRLAARNVGIRLAVLVRSNAERRPS